MKEKLVRDKIPEIKRNDGENPITRIAKPKERWKLLMAKLREESKELQESGSIEEIADILEVLDAVCRKKGYTPEEVAAYKKHKAETKGTFSLMIICKIPKKIKN